MGGGAGVVAPVAGVSALGDFLVSHRRVLVLTGAGCSTGSGIPAYRDGAGRWLQRRPILYPEFMASAATRRRYWARSYFGWPAMSKARPNAGHLALSRLARAGRVGRVITQNVDGLHHQAGQRSVIDLHGRLDRVRCLDCGEIEARDALQLRLSRLNEDWHGRVLGFNADGDAELDARDWPGFEVAPCESCGGRLKPEVVFFGESIPTATRERVARELARADALLTVGSSLVVGSAFRLVREAADRGLPVVALNRGRMRAERWLRFKVDADCMSALQTLADAMT
ncbi:NAD-dependent protein deacetylase [Wenzhouxiangella sp. AB-CW3]|nr:NAD-dependent protein deacetylase [Wenzhouxiangella sp. AB-CW3]